MTRRFEQSVAVPDFVSRRRLSRVRAAVKVVNWNGAAFARAAPASRCLLILRHPCGQVASVLAGWKSGQLGVRRQHAGQRNPGLLPDLAAGASYAKAHGIGAQEYDSLTLPAQLAWSWRAFNEPAEHALRQTSNGRIVVYEDLCRQPGAEARALFTFLALDWDSQTEDFLSASTERDASGRYFGVFRVTATVADRWRESLSHGDQEAILGVVRDSPIVRYWPDLATTR
jgi:hypothetical protein